MPLRSTPLYTGLRVRDLDRSVRFYRALGFRPILRGRTSLGDFVQLQHPVRHFTVELNWFRRGSRAWEPYRTGSQLDHFGFWVDSVDRWVRRLERVGGTVKTRAENCRIIIPPRPWTAGRAAFVADPDGVWIELMGPPIREARRPSPARRRPSSRRGRRAGRSTASLP